MADTINIPITPSDGWVLVPDAGDVFVTFSKPLEYVLSENPPLDTLFGHHLKTFEVLNFGSDTENLYVRGEGTIVLTQSSALKPGGEPRPEGLYTGLRATTVAFYSEQNKKNGTEWEASRRVTDVASGQKLYSVIKVGSVHPIDLKSRILGATGAGVIGRIYELYPSDIDSFDTPDPWYNLRFDLADPTVNQPDTLLYTEANVTFSGGQSVSDFAVPARKRGADLHQETSSQNQAAGIPASPVGSSRVVYEDKMLLLEIESLDVQNVTASLEIYEGELDLPIGG